MIGRVGRVSGRVAWVDISGEKDWSQGALYLVRARLTSAGSR